jgi:hypothetical protein
MKIPRWTWYVVAAVLAVAVFFMSGAGPDTSCPGSQIRCPGVGCVSGPDKCIPGNKGGASAVFSREGFDIMKPKPWNADWAASIPPAFRSWPGMGSPSTPPDYGKEGFVSKTCPGKYRSDGPCLMEFA